MNIKHIERYYEFYDQGCEDGAETIVFIPGVACSTWMFRDAVPLFNPKYKVLIFNNPGTNGTRVPLMFTVEKIALIVQKVFEHLNIQKATLCGHSMGGFTSQYLYKLCPEVVNRLVLVATSCGGPFTKSEIPRLIADLGPDFWKRHKAFKKNPEEGINYTFSNDFIKNNAVKYKMFAHRFFEMRPRQSTIAKHFICASRFSSNDFLHEIKAPTLIIHGLEDKLITFDGAKILNEKISNSTLLTYEKCGHFPMIEKENFYEKVLSFMEQKTAKVQKAS